eukprot:m.226381 g.226381  ORF g.226381 m.226381 type:complete len:271 (-) comp11416_c0_seq1:304-1116(-)
MPGLPSLQEERVNRRAARLDVAQPKILPTTESLERASVADLKTRLADMGIAVPKAAKKRDLIAILSGRVAIDQGPNTDDYEDLENSDPDGQLATLADELGPSTARVAPAPNTAADPDATALPTSHPRAKKPRAPARSATEVAAFSKLLDEVAGIPQPTPSPGTPPSSVSDDSPASLLESDPTLPTAHAIEPVKRVRRTKTLTATTTAAAPSGESDRNPSLTVPGPDALRSRSSRRSTRSASEMATFSKLLDEATDSPPSNRRVAKQPASD